MSPTRRGISSEVVFSAPFLIEPGAAKVSPPAAMDREKERLKKAKQRALKAAVFPKPRGRVPRGSNGVKQEWDRQSGGWHDVDAPAWCATVEFSELGAAVAHSPVPNSANVDVVASL